MQGGLVADVPHAKEHGRDEGDDYRNHGAFQVNGITHMAAAFGDPIGREGKGLESFKGALKPSESAALHEVRLDFIDEAAQVLGLLYHAAKLKNLDEFTENHFSIFQEFRNV